MYKADMKAARDSMINLAMKRFHGAPRALVIGDPTYFQSISNSVDVYATETNPEELAEAILEQIG
ncbi:unnamed protein product [Gongylonema pulchrum]|uniref:DNA polymerase III subunit alpha n=1 Tax=Gongylonema pulchrum TaxID=637853 RepID=A0A183ETV4_9BILA|nr:unnamed protein product [Gongylonema pulchrum]